jgi:hypothetical protein
VGVPGCRDAINAFFFVRNDGTIGLNVSIDNDAVDHAGIYQGHLVGRKRKLESDLQHLLVPDDPLPPCDLQSNDVDSVPVAESHLDGLTELQQEAVRFLAYRRVGALHAPVGTGKTRIMAVLAQARYEAGQIDRAVVWCPLGIREQYEHEWAIASHVPVQTFGLESISQSDRIFHEAHESVDSRTMLIIDESHLIKTPRARRTERLHLTAPHCRYVYIVTGTPITDAIQNVWSQYHTLSPAIIGVDSWDGFAQDYMIYGGPTGRDVIGYKNLSRLVAKLSPYTFTTVHGEHGATFNHVVVEPTFSAREEYREIHGDLINMLIDTEHPPHPTKIYAFLLRLHLAALKCTEARYSKIKAIAGDQQAVIFTPYVKDASGIVEYLGHDHCSVVTGERLKERPSSVLAFKRGTTQYCVCTLASGSTGLDGLQVAQKLIFAAHSWKWSERKQAIGRIARLGQQGRPMIYDMVTNLGICSKIMANLNRKTDLVDDVKNRMHSLEELRQFAEAL